MSDILVVEDNESWSSLISRLLTEQGHSVRCVSGCTQAKLLIEQGIISLAVVDINLSGHDRERDKNVATQGPKCVSSEHNCVEGEEGFHLIAWIRHFYPEVGSMILTDRKDLDDQIMGRDLGADDYAVKPIQPSDLQARVRSLLRRLGVKDIKTVVFGNWEFDNQSDTLRRIGLTDNPISISITESEIKALKLFTTRIGSLVSKRTLCLSVLGRELREKDRSIDNIVSKLRSKLDEGIAPRSSHISTVQNAGYRLEPYVAGRH